ncbi:phosphatidylcholine:ceramide cholinephosphotransferase 1 [Ditylenchus destructor]|uniref:Phosphatidylcholine:ceramide cholinephosphotransferase 1 n=1 Tax=Ditylenchus destructor TaxID=166010 RepID=A0AAD4QXR3_9BILA|nr:phosphatidylcholine:ceramide cholinephosphotransferase 1 [Ditylenchus destructor]
MKDRNGSTMKLLNRNVSADKKHIYLKLLTKEEIIRRVESPDSEYKSIFKLALALVYFLLSTYLTCAIMVYVDGRIPDGYPPLPDLFLDNIPPVPYAFEICEFIAVAMTLCWTAIITSMSVPAHHLICDRNIKGSTNFLDLLQQSFQIWFRVGLTIFGGKRTCGDYMFSGHTATITLLNHLITEYTPSEWKALHITSWGMNIVGMFLILAAHEHYRFFEAGGVGRVLNEYKFPWSVRGNSVIDAAQEFKQNGTTKNISEPLVNMEPIILVNNEANGNYRFQMKLLNKEELIKKIVMTFVDDRVPDVQKYPHTVTITLLNHFITEYTPPDWHSVHTISWVFNCFGMFFILAGHEHYRLFEAGGMGKLNNEFELPWLSDVDVDEVSEQSLSEIKETMEKITIQNKKEL